MLRWIVPPLLFMTTAQAQAIQPAGLEVDAVRAALVRRLARDPGRGQPPVCIAVAENTTTEGVDPGAELLALLGDLRFVQPFSHCRDRQKGSVLSLGPVTLSGGATEASTWTVRYEWGGGVDAHGRRLTKRQGRWETVDAANGAPIDETPPEINRGRDIERFGVLIAEFVAAWNRGETDLKFDVGMVSRDALVKERREHTRLVWQSQAVMSGKYGDLTVSVDLTLLGVFEPGPGRIWPVDPWKQTGVRTSVRLLLQRVDGWREGKWAVWFIETPWYVPRLTS